MCKCEVKVRVLSGMNAGKSFLKKIILDLFLKRNILLDYWGPEQCCWGMRQQSEQRRHRGWSKQEVQGSLRKGFFK